MDKFTRSWIIENGVPIVGSYGGNITLRALHYRLVAKGMTNSIQHYKRVIGAMIQARWDGVLSFDSFVDHDRRVEGKTDWEETILEDEIKSTKETIKYWMDHYFKNRWENQPIYPEVFIEKKALQGVFERPCRIGGVALCPCKGYPSLTYLNDAFKRFEEAGESGKECIILYFGDYDPSGEDIPRSIGETLNRMGLGVEIRRIALMENQVIERGLPPAPKKIGDSRSKNWGGLGQVELDAIEPRELAVMATDAINSLFDPELYKVLQEQQKEEEALYREELKKFVKTL